MLSRSGFSIRRLISNRKPANVEDDGDSYFIQDEIDTLKAAFKESKIISWRTPMGLRKGTRQSGLDFDIRRTEDIHKITVKIPALPGTPSSSTSSLCSCEHHIDHTSPRSSPRQAKDRSPQRSPLLCPTQLENASHPRRRSPSPQPLDESLQLPPLAPSPEHAELAQEAKIDLLEFASPNLEGVTSIPKPIQVRTVNNEAAELLGEGGVDSFSEDIQQLIRETDEAFKPTRSFSETPFSSSLFQEIAEIDRVQDLNPATTALPTRSKSQRSQSSARTPTKPHVLLATPTRFPSISKTKRTRSKKSRRRPRANLRQSSGWILPESARDLFTIRLFQRIEVNETLPESTLQEIRMSRACQTPPERHIESMEKRDEIARSGTAIEASHPDDLTSQNNDANASLAVTPAIEAVDAPQSSVRNQEEATRLDNTTAEEVPQQTQEEQQRPGVSAGVEEEEATLPILLAVEEDSPVTSKSIVFPAVPVRHQPRRLPSRQMLVPPLPTIPEVIATGPEQAILSPTSVLPPPWATTKINEDDYVFLQSTPFTLTMPTFRHGPIRLTKADMSIGKLASAVDDTLDWTAFQMAILGGAGDFFSEPTDYSRPSDAELKELDDYIACRQQATRTFAAQLNTITLIKQKQQSTEHGTSKSTAKTPEAKLDDTSIPARTEHPEGSYHCGDVGMHPLAPRPQSTDKQGMAGSSTPTRKSSVRNHVGLEIDSTRRPSNESTQSMPQSPMLDLVVSHDVEGNEYIVPMGFNLGHDLGDFLKWEAEHVFGGYYGPDP
ncbi:hypothetical protein B0T22DRAFT_436726 [Podospora appendiculata]|uniref:Uncharacterized protein n=1 Tax=Podospora appendiculata TaxID=314037 RepID=A0AAE0XHK0_9PEZI|nr:hypothetical protein B0T22DRAFT_436726 [Podospora appendiculata]